MEPVTSAAAATRILDWFKVVPLALALVFASVLLLVLPDSAVAWLGLTETMAHIRPWLAFALVVGLSLVLAHTVLALIGPFRKWRTERAGMREVRQRLHRLAPDEKGALAPLLLDQRKAVALDMWHGVTLALLSARIIGRSDPHLGIPGGHGLFMFFVQDWAWTYLNERPHLVIDDPEALRKFFDARATRGLQQQKAKKVRARSA